MIRTEGLSKQLGSFELRNIQFTLPAGYICGLVGENGAGKTTLLHLLLGLYRPDEGEVFIDGMTYAEHEKQIREEIGTVLTEELFAEWASIRTNAKYYGSYYAGYDPQQLEGYLEQFHLDGSRRYGKLSRGEKRKVQLAFALACNPKLLLLDEPAGNFDLEFRTQFFQVLKDFIADGTKSVLLASHLTDDLDQLADYLVYLEEGGQVFAGDIETFRSRYRLVMGEEKDIRRLPVGKVIHIEEGTYGATALVEHEEAASYEGLQTAVPSIEQFMYHRAKNRRKTSDWEEE